MIFSSTNHWTSDSLQWKLDAETFEQNKAVQVMTYELANDEPIFRMPKPALQEALDRDRH